MVRTAYSPHVNGAVVSAVRTAFQRARTSPRYWQSRRVQGRLDPRTAWRSTSGVDQTDVFKERLAPGATKVNVHILVDGSGSMNSNDQFRNGDKTDIQDGNRTTRSVAAADICATLVDAFRTQPTVRMNVWLHNTGSLNGGDIAVFPIVTNGKGREVIGWMPTLTGGGNGDGFAIEWVARKMKRDHRRGEQDLLIVISDGLPSWLPYNGTMGYSDPRYGNAVLHTANIVREARERDIRVMAVAIEPNPNFTEMYGDDGDVIPFDGDWNKLAVAFGGRLGITLADAGKTKRGR
jgi:hypothetical protein